MSCGKKSTWSAFPPPPHPTLIAGGLGPGRKDLPLRELLHTHAQALPGDFFCRFLGYPVSWQEPRARQQKNCILLLLFLMVCCVTQERSLTSLCWWPQI